MFDLPNVETVQIISYVDCPYVEDRVSLKGCFVAMIG